MKANNDCWAPFVFGLLQRIYSPSSHPWGGKGCWKLERRFNKNLFHIDVCLRGALSSIKFGISLCFSNMPIIWNIILIGAPKVVTVWNTKPSQTTSLPNKKWVGNTKDGTIYVFVVLKRNQNFVKFLEVSWKWHFHFGLFWISLASNTSICAQSLSKVSFPPTALMQSPI